MKFLRQWTLPVAIVVGSVAYLLFAFVPLLAPLSIVLGPLCEQILPVSVFLILFVTFAKVDLRQMRFCPWHGWILAAQLLLIVLFSVWAVWCQEASVEKYLIEAMLICMIAPCATASPVVTGKLGGNVTDMTTFTLLSSPLTALLIAAVFPVLEPQHHVSFFAAFLTILEKLAEVLVLPLVLGVAVRHCVPPLYRWILRKPNLAFYGWCFSLAITAGITVRNIVHHTGGVGVLLLIALFSMLVAVMQLWIGRRIGAHTGETVCTGQAMFQKNTALAIWVANLYLSPLSSIGAGCYVLWQNIINSWELYEHEKSQPQ